ncbi:MAG: PQQ-binding-like beta-propeller repeat protein [Chloroflexota bacterium]
MLSRKTIRLIIIIMLLALFFQVWWGYFGPGRELLNDVQEELISPLPSWPTALAKYNVQNTSAQFQELWMLDNVYGVGGNEGCNFFALQNKLLFEASFAQNEWTYLNQVDLETGDIVWRVPLKPEGPSVLTYDVNTLFYGYGIPGNIIAYDIESGNQLWERTLSWREKNIISYMQATNDNLYVNSSSLNFQVFDTSTGTPKELAFQTDAFPIFYVDNSVFYHREIDRKILAAELATGHTVWEASFHEPIKIAPLFTEKLIIVKTGSLGIGQVYVLDRSTGEDLWQQPHGAIDWENPANIVGNVAEHNGYIFYITLNAELLAINAETGEVVGSVQFSPGLNELDGSDRVNREFCIAASDNIVAVYFGSGQQLFSFRFLPDE